MSASRRDLATHAADRHPSVLLRPLGPKPPGTAVRVALALVDGARRCSPPPLQQPDDPHARAVDLVVRALLEDPRHQRSLARLARELQPARRLDGSCNAEALAVSASRIVATVFDDGVRNCGRVCTVYAFLVILARQLLDDERRCGSDGGAGERSIAIDYARLADHVGHALEEQLDGRFDWDELIPFSSAGTGMLPWVAAAAIATIAATVAVAHLFRVNR